MSPNAGIYTSADFDVSVNLILLVDVQIDITCLVSTDLSLGSYTQILNTISSDYVV